MLTPKAAVDLTHPAHQAFLPPLDADGQAASDLGKVGPDPELLEHILDQAQHPGAVDPKLVNPGGDLREG